MQQVILSDENCGKHAEIIFHALERLDYVDLLGLVARAFIPQVPAARTARVGWLNEWRLTTNQEDYANLFPLPYHKAADECPLGGTHRAFICGLSCRRIRVMPSAYRDSRHPLIRGQRLVLKREESSKIL